MIRRHKKILLSDHARTESATVAEQLAEIARPPEWMKDALCVEVDWEAFFVSKGGSVQPAKRICGLCEVATECLEFALANDIRYGIFGGVTGWERRQLKRGAA